MIFLIIAIFTATATIAVISLQPLLLFSESSILVTTVPLLVLALVVLVDLDTKMDILIFACIRCRCSAWSPCGSFGFP